MANQHPASVSLSAEPVRRGSAAGMASLLRRANRQIPAEVPTLRPGPTGACGSCALPATGEPSPYSSPPPGPPAIPWDRVRDLPEGVELMEGGRRWFRIEGGQPVKIYDGWETGAIIPWTGKATEQDEAAEPVQVALNFPNFFAFETEGMERYGPAASLVADLHRHGVKIVRHPGKAQLFLDGLIGAGRTTPISPTLLEDDEELRRLIRGSESFSNLLQLARLLHAHDMKMLVTIITLGGGSEGSSAWEGGRVAESPKVLWDDSFIDREFEDAWGVDGDTVAFNRATPDGARRLDVWDRESLDPENPVKRMFCRKVCGIVAALLDELASTPPWAMLKTVLAGIEIGNELDLRQVALTESGVKEVNPAAWGPWYADCAVAMREQNDWLPLWLPGLASYAEEGRGRDRRSVTWSGKLAWTAALLVSIQARLTALDRPDILLADIVAGMDVHWYHRDDAARRRAVLLTLELKELRRALIEGAGEQLGNAILLTMIESGVNTLCGPEERSTWGDDTTDCPAHAALPEPDYRPPVYRILTVFGEAHARRVNERAHPLHWQAANLVTVLTMAIAGGARIVGPHGHVELSPGASARFAGMGIREDRHEDGTAADAAMRPSGASLRRLSRLLSGAGDVRLIHPTDYLSSLGEPRTLNRESVGTDLALKTYPLENHACVVELEGMHLWQTFEVERRVLGRKFDGLWGYLMFIDSVPSENEPGSDDTPGGMQVALISTDSPSVWEIGVLPEGIEPATRSGDDDFPWAEVRFDGPTDVEVERVGLAYRVVLRLARGEGPRLVLSTHRLRVGSVRTLAEL